MPQAYNLTMSKFLINLFSLLAKLNPFHSRQSHHSLSHPPKHSIYIYTTRSIKVIFLISLAWLLYSLFSLSHLIFSISLTLALSLTLLPTLLIFSTSILSTQNLQVIRALFQIKKPQYQADHPLHSSLFKNPSTLIAQTITYYQIKVTNFVVVRNLIKLGTAVIVLLVLTNTPALAAANPSPPPYKIKFVNLDTAPSTQSSQLSSSPIKQIQDFTFTISDLSISFSDLAPNTLVTKTNTLTIAAPGTNGYSITATTNHPLKLQSSTTAIPDTTCDQNDCNQTTAAPWTKTTTHGFGYNLTGDDLPTDFINSTHFRPFTNQSSPTILTRTKPTTKSTATVTYQLNVPATQATGDYQNQINYVALPTY